MREYANVNWRNYNIIFDKHFAYLLLDDVVSFASDEENGKVLAHVGQKAKIDPELVEGENFARERSERFWLTFWYI